MPGFIQSCTDPCFPYLPKEGCSCLYNSPLWASDAVQFMGLQVRLLAHVTREFSKRSSLVHTLPVQMSSFITSLPALGIIDGGEGKGYFIRTCFPPQCQLVRFNTFLFLSPNKLSFFIQYFQQI